MIIKPPISVQNAGTSFIKTQTQKGPNANSMSIKKVNSAANKCLEEYKKIIFGTSDMKLPSKKHLNKSNQVNEKFFPITVKQKRLMIIPEIARAGNISILRFLRTVIAKTENEIAVKSAINRP